MVLQFTSHFTQKVARNGLWLTMPIADVLYLRYMKLEKVKDSIDHGQNN
jgi:hypothetical protein